VNKVLRRIFGLNRVDVAGSRINLREMVGGGEVWSACLWLMMGRGSGLL